MTAQPLEPSYLLHPDAADLESATTPLWDEAFAATDDETRVYLRALAVAGPVEPVKWTPREFRSPIWEANMATLMDEANRPLFPAATKAVRDIKAATERNKVATPRPAKPAKKAPTADAEARLRKVRKTVAARMAEDFGPGMGGPK